MNRPVFVYGILKRRPDAKPGKVAGFRMFDYGGFPAAVPSGDTDVLVGELIHVDDETVERFDMIEGYPNFYDRQGVKVETEDGEVVDAEMYVVTESNWQPSVPTNRLIVDKVEERTTYEYDLDG